MSSSDSTTKTSSSTSTSSADQRLAFGTDGVGGTASSGGTVNITNTDGGAFDVVKQSVDVLAKTHEDVLSKLLDGFTLLVDKAAQATSDSNTLAHDALLAYAPIDTAKTELSKNTTIVLGIAAAAAALAFAAKR
jgi:hypothetical protein